jgi:hypothetical protein
VARKINNVPIGTITRNQADTVTSLNAKSLQPGSASSNALGELTSADVLKISPCTHH